MTEQKNKYWQFTKKFILKPLKWFLLTLVFLFVAVLVMLRIPYCQTKIANFASEEISKTLQHKVKIGHVDLNWIDKLALQDVVIYDVENLPLIAVGEIEADFDLSTIYTPNKILLENVTLNRAEVTIKNIGNTNELNMSHFADIILELTKSTGPVNKKKKYTSFNIAKITLVESKFTFDENTEPHRAKGFDNYHFGFSGINGEVSEFRLIADTVDILLKNFTGIERKTKLELCKINTFLRITDNSIRMHQLEALIGNSIIRDSLVMKFDAYRDFNDFNHKIKVEGNLKDCMFYTKDLAVFNEYLSVFDDYWQINGAIKGTVDAFSLKNATLGFGQSSFLEGDFRFDGLPNFWQTFLDFKIRKSFLNGTDISQYANTDFDKVFSKFQYLKIKGKVVGFPTDFVTSAKYSSAIGDWDTDINLKIDSKKGMERFVGDITTYDLDLGKLTNNEKRVQTINLTGHIEGNGFDPDQSEVKLKAHITDVSIEHVKVHNIETDALWSKSKFSGFINVKDSNVTLTANGLFDLRDNINEFKIDAKIDKFDLKALGITKTNTVFSAETNLNFKGLKLDDLVGVINIDKLDIKHESKTLYIDNIFVNSWNLQSGREFSLKSDLVNFNAKGDFLFSRIGDELLNLYKEYEDYYINQKIHTLNLYSQKNKTYKRINQDVVFDIQLKDFNKITNLVLPELSINKNVKIDGYIKIDENYKIDVKTDVASLKYKKHAFENFKINMKSLKSVMNDDIQNTTSLEFKKYAYNASPMVDDFKLGAYWKRDSILFVVDALQAKNNIDVSIDGTLRFDKQNSQTLIRLKDEKLELLQNKWHLNNENLLVFKNNELRFNDYLFVADSQVVKLEGFVSDDKSKTLDLELQNVKLNILNPFLNIKLSGVTNSKIQVKGLKHTPVLVGDVLVDKLEIDGIKYGDLKGSAEWADNTDFLKLNADLYNNNQKIVNLTGNVYPEAEEQQLKLNANFVHTPINIVEPMMGEVLTNMKGEANGALAITGTFAKPLVLGQLKVDNGSFNVDYLNTTYFFTDYVYFTENMIGVKSAKIYDAKRNEALVKGGVYHNYFSDYKMNLAIYSKKIHALNTTYKENNMYYGDAYVSGSMKIYGPFDDLTLEGDLKSLVNTRLHIPIGGITKVNRENFISFVNRKAPVSQAKTDSIKEKALHTSRLKMKLNLFLTPDAYNEIIFDQKSGDIIRGTGNGKITMEIDTKGDFNMFGDYVFDAGRYNFTMFNVINKDFEIKSGSKISWYGDPYAGKLDVKASYVQQASLLPIVAEGTTPSKADSLLLKRRYPSVVNLGLTGDLMAPEVNLGIEVTQTPANINLYVQDFRTRLATNEQELNRQVFSLVMLGRFSPESSLGDGKSLVSSGLSEFFSNQLNQWMSQVDEDLQIDLDLNTTNADGLNFLKLRLSRAFLDSRLRVSVEDGFSNTGKSNPNASAAGLAGNWTVEYMLLKNGVLRLKVYNRTTQVANVTNNTITNTSLGVSILHTKDFDRLLELLNLDTGEENARKERERKSKENNKDKKDIPPTSINLQMPNQRPKDEDVNKIE